jgi:anthranilate phosphoribosyltransferase
MTYEQTQQQFELLFQNKLSDNEAKELLVSMHKRGETSQEIAAAASVMRKYSTKLEIPEHLKEGLIDIVGTGGDRSGSFNISSTVSLVLASLGCLVAKHGNRSITSKSGSADMLEALGINLNLSPENQVKMLEEVGFTFMFAINHHPAMKHIMPIRKSLSHPTVFNILGPLTNPAGSKKYLLGVFEQALIPKMINALQILGATDAMVVNSYDGLDEISISEVTYFSYLHNDELQNGLIEPTKYGCQTYPIEDIKGGDAAQNAQITLDIFNGKEQGAKLEIIALNAGMALMVAGKVKTPKEGVKMVKEAIKSGKVLEYLEKIISVSRLLGE